MTTKSPIPLFSYLSFGKYACFKASSTVLNIGDVFQSWPVLSASW
jgi:hypothetical protein